MKKERIKEIRMLIRAVTRERKILLNEQRGYKIELDELKEE